MQTVVVAKQPLRFDTELNASMLAGSDDAERRLRKISDVLHGGRRAVLTAIEPNEQLCCWLRRISVATQHCRGAWR